MFAISSLNFDYNEKISPEGQKVVWIQVPHQSLIPLELQRNTIIRIDSLPPPLDKLRGSLFKVCETAGSTILLDPLDKSRFPCGKNQKWGFQTGGAVGKIVNDVFQKNVGFANPSRANHSHPIHGSYYETPYSHLEKDYLNPNFNIAG